MDEESSSLAKNQVIVYLIVEYTPLRVISAAIFDDRKRLFQFTSFNDNEHYTNLESLLIQTNPHEREDNFFVHIAIKTQIKSEVQKLTDKLQNLNFKIDTTSKSSTVDIKLALSNLLEKDLALYVKVLDDKKGVIALERLLSFLRLQQDETNKKKFDLQKFTFEKFMRLDQPAINALQIFPKDMEKKILAGTNTIFEILNKCKTQIGTRCLKRWMRQPLQNSEQINERLDKVSFFLKNPAIKNTIQNELKKLPDLDNLYYTFYKVEAGKKNNVQVNDLIKIYRTVDTMKNLLKNLSDSGNSDLPEIVGTVVQIEKNVNVMGMISRMIQDNIIMEGNRQSEFHVRPDAQKQLSVIAKQQQKINNQIREHIESVKKDLGVEVQKLLSTTYKYVLEADKKKSIDRVKQLSDYKYLTSKQNKITFTTDTLISLCKNYSALEDQYKEEEKKILTKMYKVVAGYFPIMEELSILLSQLDVITTFATVINSSSSTQAPWSRPKFTNFLKGSKIHHPCIRTCIPNDCDLSNYTTIILTGPNMGGKSTYIRTIGLAAYLAHIGCFVPAKQFQVSIIDSIITRVGASDMQMKGISTFMSQMIQSITMLQSSTSKSLVLIDQLGRGTSTSEGFGIAWAICHQLHTKIRPYCLFATHFHEMTKMADELQGVCNMHTSCKITEQKLHLQYKVLQGKMQKSYGIQVAKMLHFPQKIIKDAQQYLELYEQNNPEAEQMGQGQPLSEKQKQVIRLFKEMRQRISAAEQIENVKNIKREYRARMKEVFASGL